MDEFSKSLKNSNGTLSKSVIMGFIDYLSWQIHSGEPCCIVNIPSTNGCSMCASAHFSFGVSSRTKNISGCWNFLKFTMDDAVLSKITLGMESAGFPMKKSLMMDQIERAQLPATNEYSIIHHWGEDAIPLTQTDALRLIEQLDKIDCVQKRCTSVLEIVIEESAPYFNDEKGIDETLKLIQNRSSIYLSEQN